MSINIISLNAHSTQILSASTPVEVKINPGGREVLVFTGENISEYVLLELPATTLPVPKVGTTQPQAEVIEVETGVSIPVQVSSGVVIQDLPDEVPGVLYMTSYPTSKAVSELGRKDFINAGPTVFSSYDEATGKGVGILGCIGVNRFA